VRLDPKEEEQIYHQKRRGEKNLPTIVLITLVDGSTTRTRLLFKSAINNFIEVSTEIPPYDPKSIFATDASPPSPEKPDVPLVPE
jgi:hypothetical protein